MLCKDSMAQSGFRSFSIFLFCFFMVQYLFIPSKTTRPFKVFVATNRMDLRMNFTIKADLLPCDEAVYKLYIQDYYCNDAVFIRQGLI